MPDRSEPAADELMFNPMDIGANAGDFTIGFIGLSPKEDKAQPIGTGTLATLGAVKGVVTCAHVIDRLRKECRVGLVHFSTARKVARLAIDVQLLDSVQLGPSGNDKGPDIGFIRLPESLAADLRVHSSFLNLALQVDLASQPGRIAERYFDLVVGVIGEWMTQAGKTVHVSALSSIGRMTITADGPLDLCRITPAKPDNVTPPESYGGVSGGGLWRFHYNGPDEALCFVARRFQGVAFYETGELDIIGHGPRSVLETLVAEIRQKWGAA